MKNKSKEPVVPLQLKKTNQKSTSGKRIYWTNYDPYHDFAITYKPKTIYNGPKNIEDAKKLFGDRKLDLQKN